MVAPQLEFYSVLYSIFLAYCFAYFHLSTQLEMDLIVVPNWSQIKSALWHTYSSLSPDSSHQKQIFFLCYWWTGFILVWILSQAYSTNMQDHSIPSERTKTININLFASLCSFAAIYFTILTLLRKGFRW